MSMAQHVGDDPLSARNRGERHIVIAWIGLGGNQGDVVATFRRAIDLLGTSRGLWLGRLSPLYRTAPVGCSQGQPWFLNAVLEVSTRLSPPALHRRLMAVERLCGRRRRLGEVNAPRPLDLDLLFHGEAILEGPTLILPHPRLHVRRFVLRPLADLAPGLLHPLLGKTVDSLLRAVEDDAPVDAVGGLTLPHGPTVP